jgi:hypothetical protein
MFIARLVAERLGQNVRWSRAGAEPVVWDRRFPEGIWVGFNPRQRRRVPPADRRR